MSNNLQNDIIEDDEILDLLYDIIFNKITQYRHSNLLKSPKIPADIIFNELKNSINIEENTFMRFLNQFEIESPTFYNCLSLPSKWNRSARFKYPEAFPAPDRILYIIKKPINANDIYEDVGKRIWNVNEKVWLPKNHFLTEKYLFEDALEIISEYQESL